jgi:hypothetical protein
VKETSNKKKLKPSNSSAKKIASNEKRSLNSCYLGGDRLQLEPFKNV